MWQKAFHLKSAYIDILQHCMGIRDNLKICFHVVVSNALLNPYKKALVYNRYNHIYYLPSHIIYQLYWFCQFLIDDPYLAKGYEYVFGMGIRHECNAY